jgi:hypothetical protein
MAGKPGHEMTRTEKMEAHNRHEKYADQILDMHLRGESFRAIEAATGVPRSTAQAMCQRLSADYVKNRYNDKTAVLGRELAILDSLTRKNLKRAQDGDKPSADIVLNAHIRRSKLLGLDAAVKAELTVRSAQDIEIERLVSLMTAGGGTEGPESGSDRHTAGMAGGSE